MHISYQKSFIKFKEARKLLQKLMNSIQPLEENWALLILIFHLFLVTTAITKLVTKIQPIWFNKHLETLWTQEKTNCRQLCCRHLARQGKLCLLAVPGNLRTSEGLQRKLYLFLVWEQSYMNVRSFQKQSDNCYFYMTNSHENEHKKYREAAAHWAQQVVFQSALRHWEWGI